MNDVKEDLKKKCLVHLSVLAIDYIIGNQTTLRY